MAQPNVLRRIVKSFLKGFGTSMRSMGRSVDSVGLGVQGKFGHYEHMSRHQQFHTFMGVSPSVGEAVFVAPNASLIGDVTIGDKSSVWYGAVVRGDVNKITIGSKTNIQDRAIVHVSEDPSALVTSIGDLVSIGHRAVVQSSIVEDESVIGMGAIVMEGCKVSKNAYVAPGAVLPPKTVVNTGELWAGSPASMIRTLTNEEIEKIVLSAEDYLLISEAHHYETTKDYERIEFDRLKRKILDARSPQFQRMVRAEGMEDQLSEVQARVDLEQRKKDFGG